jgi:hypothetical protein
LLQERGTLLQRGVARELIDESGQPEAAHREVRAAGGMRESGGEVAFANAGGTGDQQVKVLLDPGEIGELGEDCRIDAARRARVEVLKTGVLRQLGPAQALRQAVAGPIGDLVLDQKP